MAEGGKKLEDFGSRVKKDIEEALKIGEAEVPKPEDIRRLYTTLNTSLEDLHMKKHPFSAKSRKNTKGIKIEKVGEVIVDFT